MSNGRRSVVLAVLVLAVLSSLVGSSPVQACGHVKCNEPSEAGCWRCTYSLYLFQRCHYWCRESATGALHSSCWEEECYQPVDLQDAESGWVLASLGVDVAGSCDTGESEGLEGQQGQDEALNHAAVAVRASELAPRS